jgi:hypothetical protein
MIKNIFIATILLISFGLPYASAMDDKLPSGEPHKGLQLGIAAGATLMGLAYQNAQALYEAASNYLGQNNSPATPRTRTAAGTPSGSPSPSPNPSPSPSPTNVPDLELVPEVSEDSETEDEPELETRPRPQHNRRVFMLPDGTVVNQLLIANRDRASAFYALGFGSRQEVVNVIQLLKRHPLILNSLIHAYDGSNTGTSIENQQKLNFEKYINELPNSHQDSEIIFCFIGDQCVLIGDLPLLAAVKGNLNLEIYTLNLNFPGMLQVYATYNTPEAADTLRLLYTAEDYNPSERHPNPLAERNHFDLLLTIEAAEQFNPETFGTARLANPAEPFLTEFTWLNACIHHMQTRLSSIHQASARRHQADNQTQLQIPRTIEPNNTPPEVEVPQEEPHPRPQAVNQPAKKMRKTTNRRLEWQKRPNNTFKYNANNRIQHKHLSIDTRVINNFEALIDFLNQLEISYYVPNFPLINIIIEVLRRGIGFTCKENIIKVINLFEKINSSNDYSLCSKKPFDGILICLFKLRLILNEIRKALEDPESLSEAHANKWANALQKLLEFAQSISLSEDAFFMEYIKKGGQSPKDPYPSCTITQPTSLADLITLFMSCPLHLNLKKTQNMKTVFTLDERTTLIHGFFHRDAIRGWIKTLGERFPGHPILWYLRNLLGEIHELSINASPIDPLLPDLNQEAHAYLSQLLLPETPTSITPTPITIHWPPPSQTPSPSPSPKR